MLVACNVVVFGVCCCFAIVSLCLLLVVFCGIVAHMTRICTIVWLYCNFYWWHCRSIGFKPSVVAVASLGWTVGVERLQEIPVFSLFYAFPQHKAAFISTEILICAVTPVLVVYHHK